MKIAAIYSVFRMIGCSKGGVKTMNLFEGINVIDLTNNHAGPACGSILSDFGADVIHVEKPIIGDDNRAYAPVWNGVSLACAMYNRGKKSVVIDTKDPEGLEVLKQMIMNADILIESFRPGVMQKLGLAYDDVKDINPKLIYCSISAFGQKGLYAKRPGYDIIAQGFSGFMHKTGEKDGPPFMTGITIGDAVGAINAFGCIAAALFHRERTGEGQHIDVALTRGLMWCNSFFEFINMGIDDRRNGNTNSSFSPYGVFSNDKGEAVVIAALSNSLWAKVCKILGHEEMTSDPRYATISSRGENKEDINRMVSQWVNSFENIADAVSVLEAEGIPNTKVMTHFDLLNDVHVRENNWIVDIPVPDDLIGPETYKTHGVIADFSLTPGNPIKKTDTLGQHNHEVLGEYLTVDTIDRLEAKWAKK